MSAAPDVKARAHDVRPRAFTLELTKGCNLRCGYCYYAAREDAYDPRTTMAPEVAEAAVERLLTDGPQDQPLHLHLFGGEPLLNLPLLRHVLEYGARRAAEAGRTLTFEVTTNGTRFGDEVIALLNAHAVAVGVSFDGPPEVQDAARPALAGSSHARAAPGIRAFLASRKGTLLEQKTHCSVVVTKRELDLVKIVAHLEELGFVKILLTPATDSTGNAWGIADSDLPALLAAYDALAADYEARVRAGRAVSVQWFPRLMGRVLSGERKTSPCSGGLDYLGVAADGSVALCYRFYDSEEHRMGDVRTGIDRGVTERLLSQPLEQRLACGTCWARWFCGGGCHHDNLIATGGMGDPNPVTCTILRHGMDATLRAWARLTKDGYLQPVRPKAAGNGRAAMQQQQGSAGFALGERPKTKSTCHVQELGLERVVYEPTSHEVVALNATAAQIFALCDGTRSVAEIAAALGRRFAAPAEVLQRDLLDTLERFRRAGLLA